MNAILLIVKLRLYTRPALALLMRSGLRGYPNPTRRLFYGYPKGSIFQFRCLNILQMRLPRAPGNIWRQKLFGWTTDIVPTRKV